MQIVLITSPLTAATKVDVSATPSPEEQEWAFASHGDDVGEAGIVVFEDAGGGSFSEMDRYAVATSPVLGVTGYRDLAGDLVLAYASDSGVSAMRVLDESIVWTSGPFGVRAGTMNALDSAEISTDSGVLVLIGSSYSVHQLGGPQAEIFSDGFESGSTGAWDQPENGATH